jgi:hypothetical protein
VEGRGEVGKQVIMDIVHTCQNVIEWNISSVVLEHVKALLKKQQLLLGVHIFYEQVEILCEGGNKRC